MVRRVRAVVIAPVVRGRRLAARRRRFERCRRADRRSFRRCVRRSGRNRRVRARTLAHFTSRARASEKVGEQRRWVPQAIRGGERARRNSTARRRVDGVQLQL